MRLFVLGLIALSTSALGQSQVQNAPMQSFLTSADQNDFVTMQSVMDPNVMWTGARISPHKFAEKISNCYLRRVYSQNQTGEILAAWMCAEGKEKSRVVIANVAQKNGRVSVSVVREDRNNRPAPARSGSAFADGTGAH
jgi:hypothetical protein